MASVSSIILQLQEPSLKWKNHSQYSPQLLPGISFPRSHIKISKNLKKLCVNCSFTTNDRSATDQRVSKISFGKLKIKQKPVEIMAEAIKNMLKALREPAIAALVVGLLLMSDPNSALAASGGRMGGRAFSSRSSSSSSPSRSYSTSSWSDSVSSSPSRSYSASSWSDSVSSSPSRSYSTSSWSDSVSSSPSRSYSASSWSDSVSSSPSRSYSVPSSPSWSYSTSSWPSQSALSSSDSESSPSRSYSAASSSEVINELIIMMVYIFAGVIVSEILSGFRGSVLTVTGTGKTSVLTRTGKTSELTRTSVFTRTGKTSELTGTGKTSVLKVQVGLLGSGRSLQTDLNRIAEMADTSTIEGLHYVLTETVVALLRHPDYCISGYSSVDVKRSMEDGEILFNRLSIEERSKFDEETLVNVDNIKRQSSTIHRAGGVSNEYIAVTILVAADGEHKLPSVNNNKDLKEALQKLASIPSSKTKAVEVLWTPQNEDDTLSEQELLKDYPLLRPL